MRVAVIHGYYLSDSGSGIYVREVVRQLVRQGHEVTLVCQERRPELYDFIDAAYTLDASNAELIPGGVAAAPRYPGSCRLVRPNLSRLLVYVRGPFPGFEAEHIETFQESPVGWIDTYVAENLSALRAMFAAWPPEIVLAGHAFMPPYLARHSLSDSPYVATVHGSELNFSLRCDERLVPYGLAGLEGAAAVVSVSDSGAAEVIAWAAEQGLDIAAKTLALPPGVDPEVFTPADSRRVALEALRSEMPLVEELQVSEDDVIIAFAGRLLWTKGIQYVISCLPLVLEQQPRARLLVAGEGPAREALERIARLLGSGDEAAARALAESADCLRAATEFGPVIPAHLPAVGPLPVHFLGHLDSVQLAGLFAAADISLAPSVFPEAFGLVTIEALSAGALPLAGFHSGMASVVEIVAEALDDPSLKGLIPGACLTEELARLIVDVLARYPTRDPAFRQRLREICRAHFSSWGEVAEQYLRLAG